jgi:predicted nucleotidyltransferase
MQVNGIIAEYNPFHNGHKYHLEESLRRTGADYTIVIMSGDFVQRGAPALMDKHVRARAALCCGADLVLELPVLYATSSAEYFAHGAVSIFDKLGVITHLCFGSECADTALLRQTAEILLEEPSPFRHALKEFLRQGFPYPAARCRALEQCGLLSGASLEALAQPNNILGIDYIKALLKRHSKIQPVTVKRQGPGYHDSYDYGKESHKEPSSEPSTFWSALALRQALFAGDSPGRLAGFMPPETSKLIAACIDKKKLLQAEDFSSLLYYKLLLEKAQGYETYLDVSPALSRRISKLLGDFTAYETFCSLLKTRDMTYSRVSRCLLHILLNITKDDMAAAARLDHAPYARILGFRRSALPLLGALGKCASIPLITKLADAQKSLSPDACRLLEQDILSSHIYQSAACVPNGSGIPNEISTPLVIL